MINNKLDNFNNQLRSIDKLMDDGKIRLAFHSVSELLGQSPNNRNLNYQLMRIYSFMGNYEQALEVGLKKLEEELVFTYLAALAIETNNMEKMEYFYQKYFKERMYLDDCKRYCQHRLLQVYLQRIFEPSLIKIYDEDSYSVRQLIDYNFDEAVKYIVEKHSKIPLEEKSIFDSSIHIPTLMKRVKKIIENDHHQSSFLVSLRERYLIKYPSVGKYVGSEGKLGLIIVGTNYNSSEIINMYPSSADSFGKVLDFNVPEEIESVNVKKLSQIDKFNLKYGLK